MEEQLQLFGDDWTERKLTILTKYLAAYNTALQKQPFKRVYVDAFAGTGYREQRQQLQPRGFFSEADPDAERFRAGSTRRALAVSPAFHRYLFVEVNAAKVGELEKLRDAYPDKRGQIQIVRGDANEEIISYCNRERWRAVRAVMFLDPFATEVRWTTIETIAATQGVDLWYLFPLMAVNRLLAGDPAKAFEQRLDAVFGGHEWRNAFYRKRRPGFFDHPDGDVEKACNMRAIGDYFRSKLRSVFAGVAQTRCVLRNHRGSPLFQFFFAASNPRGAERAVGIADDILLRELSDGR